MNNNYIVVFDLETDDNKPENASIVQIAAKVICPRKLELVENASFAANVKPNFATSSPQTIQWHADKDGVSYEDILAKWATFPEPEVVWPEFIKFLDKYQVKVGKKCPSPVAAGANIVKFDLPIVHRYNELYSKKPKRMFHLRDKIDLLDWFFPWFENNADVDSLSMDAIRDYLGISKVGAHDAIKDVDDSAEIIMRFMKLYRQTAANIKFKNSFILNPVKAKV